MFKKMSRVVQDWRNRDIADRLYCIPLWWSLVNSRWKIRQKSYVGVLCNCIQCTQHISTQRPSFGHSFSKFCHRISYRNRIHYLTYFCDLYKRKKLMKTIRSLSFQIWKHFRNDIVFYWLASWVLSCRCRLQKNCLERRGREHARQQLTASQAMSAPRWIC